MSVVLPIYRLIRHVIMITAMSSPGHVIIAGLGMIAFPRAIEPTKGPRNMAFDVNFNIKDGGKKPTLGLLRYFVPDFLYDQVQKLTDDDFVQAFVIATISMVPPNGLRDESIITEDLELSDYAFIGDIMTLIFTESNNVNNFYEPYVILAGNVTECTRDVGAFRMLPSQYTNLAHAPADFPSHCFITDSPRWANKKPQPAIGSTVSVGGFLHEVKRNTESNSVSSFEIELTNIAYLTRQNLARTVQTTDHSSKPSTRSRTRYNFDTAEPSQAGPSSSAPQKRKTSTENSDGSEDDKNDDRRKAKQARIQKD
ncbi:hypothetical protein BDZ97DRAFT_2070693 [Flammula alnicola]|nr:hypothetical protein BDZ97DRAFT_2070693 [Flammula alnicola]